MMYGKRKLRIAYLLLIVVMAMNSFAAVVSDNDGSAFITKAEFESLKKGFERQISDYQASIDSKIDGQITAYLEGIKLTRMQKVSLDTKSNYSFPLYMLSDDSWNNPDSPYFSVSIPKFNSYQAEIKWATSSSGAPTTGTARKLTIPAMTGLNDARNNIIRVGYNDRKVEYDGKEAQLFIVKKTNKKKKIGQDEYSVFDIDKLGIGKFQLTYIKPTAYGAISDAGPANSSTYLYIGWIGLTNNQVSNNNKTASWVGGEDNILEWNATTEIRSYSLGTSGTSKNPAITDDMTFKETITKWNEAAETSTRTNGSFSRSEAYFGEPKSKVIDWKTNSVVNYVFVGDAMMPANVDGYWALNPHIDGDSKITKCAEFSQAPQNISIFNLNSSSYTVNTFSGTNYHVFPIWKAAKNESYKQETNNNFSQMRASLVSYQDSKGKTHYMDEGMFLGNYDYEGIVGFTLQFTGDTNVKLSLSKKPFAYDANAADKLTYKVRQLDSASTNNKTEAELIAGKSYRITIDDIKKNDQLYMKWVPVDKSKIVRLAEFTNYVIETYY